jgi:toxin-antitoxin system PIN domain toxin
LVLSGFLRVVTHPRIFDPPTDLELALRFVETVRESADCVVVAPGPKHWSIFARLVRESGCRGNLIPDAFLAAIAIESGCTWITTDRDYSRFAGLNWRHPLDGDQT